MSPSSLNTITGSQQTKGIRKNVFFVAQKKTRNFAITGHFIISL